MGGGIAVAPPGSRQVNRPPQYRFDTRLHPPDAAGSYLRMSAQRRTCAPRYFDIDRQEHRRAAHPMDTGPGLRSAFDLLQRTHVPVEARFRYWTDGLRSARAQEG